MNTIAKCIVNEKEVEIGRMDDGRAFYVQIGSEYRLLHTISTVGEMMAWIEEKTTKNYQEQKGME